MNDNTVRTKSFLFALKVVELSDVLDRKKKYALSNQILKSGTAIGALIREAEQAESKADFIHKLSISLKEANETIYWLELFNQSRLITDEMFSLFNDELMQIFKMLTAIINTSKKSLGKK
jgi:four helix bundle protein